MCYNNAIESVATRIAFSTKRHSRIGELPGSCFLEEGPPERSKRPHTVLQEEAGAAPAKSADAVSFLGGEPNKGAATGESETRPGALRSQPRSKQAACCSPRVLVCSSSPMPAVAWVVSLVTVAGPLVGVGPVGPLVPVVVALLLVLPGVVGAFP